jgi:hypothetical protein
MLVFLDFEASSLAKKSVPIEVAWVFEDGTSESHLIRPAPDWTDWDEEAEAIHGIPRATLLADGVPHDVVARRMVDVLSGHDLFASAPSWDGKWLSALLRAAGLPRHALRLRDSEIAFHDAARAGLPNQGPAAEKRADRIVAEVMTRFSAAPPAHRALADAERELERWHAARALSDEPTAPD